MTFAQDLKPGMLLRWWPENRYERRPNYAEANDPNAAAAVTVRVGRSHLYEVQSVIVPERDIATNSASLFYKVPGTNKALGSVSLRRDKSIEDQGWEVE